MGEFSDYIIYADESGDHSLTKIDPVYPVFVLCLCVFRKRDYVRHTVPAVQRLKFKWFGHDTVVLHENDIRKQRGPFVILTNSSLRQEFMDDLNALLRASRMSIVACAIDKQRLRNEDLFPDNPYSIALRICLERTQMLLESREEAGRLTHFLFERRGDKEDNELELEFRRITDGHNRFGRRLDHFDIRMVDKRVNSSGLQIADLTARPIGLHILRPNQPNRAFEIIRTKLTVGVRKSGLRGRIALYP